MIDMARQSVFARRFLTNEPIRSSEQNETAYSRYNTEEVTTK